MATTLAARLRGANPLLADAVLAVALAVLVCLQLWLIASMRPEPSSPHMGGGAISRGAIMLRDPAPFGGGMRRAPNRAPDALTYVLAAACFLPLAIRRKVPWLAFALTGSAAMLYALRPAPPAFTMLGPMIALFTMAATASRRRTGVAALVVAGVVVAVPLFAFSQDIFWFRDVITAFVLLAAAAFLGDAERSRREYTAEVEQRAIEAERTREEEARRRVDEERIRISRDIHDLVAHSLSIVTVQSAAAEALIDDDPERARESVRAIRDASKDALAELRSMLDVLRTGEGDAPRTPTADLTHVEALAAGARQAGLSVTVREEGEMTAVPAFASVSAYRIVQEALTNVVRHADATHVDIEITATEERVNVAVADDGGGLDGTSSSRGHGLRGMQERAEALGGTLTLGSSAAGGTLVTASIPLSRGIS